MLNVTGAVALVPLAWDAFATRDRAGRRRTRLGLWLFMALCQAGLFALHAHLNSLFDVVAMDVGDHDVFHLAHRALPVAAHAAVGRRRGVHRPDAARLAGGRRRRTLAFPGGHQRDQRAAESDPDRAGT